MTKIRYTSLGRSGVWRIVLDLAILLEGTRPVNVLTGESLGTDSSHRLPIFRAMMHFPGAPLVDGAAGRFFRFQSSRRRPWGNFFIASGFPLSTGRSFMVVTPLRVALIARHLHYSVSSIAGSSCDAGDCLASE